MHEVLFTAAFSCFLAQVTVVNGILGFSLSFVVNYTMKTIKIKK